MFREYGFYGAGMVGRNHKGELIQAKTVRTASYVSSDFAEVMAIKEALSWIEDQTEWTTVILEPH